ncbi:hypothetical protein GCM10017635_30390 [Paracoccus kondratievae]|uniref:Helix-turn-helix domain-containing protein n=1 Tax=Paracoccus kondratievae TaxID=135740 RepID=A0AAD3P0Y4_9RHOB|nr:hypothetical protein GCM10017635_30390 [Paracoccus kondratievae]
MFAQNRFQSLSEKVMMVGVTCLLEAGAELKEIATHMGWSIKHVAKVIKRHVALLPSMTDGLAEKLQRAESRTKLQIAVQISHGEI